MKKNVFLFFIVSLLLAIIAGCSLGKPYAVKIGQDLVGASEFRFYFVLSQRAYEEEGGTDIWETTINGMKAEEVAKDRALESLTVVKISCGQADSLGVGLTEEDKEKALEMTEMYKTTIGDADLTEIGITDLQMTAIMEETILYRKVFNEITKNVVVSENDFNDYFAEHVNDSELEGKDFAAEKRNELRRQYLDDIKNDVFSEQFSKWSANVQITKNADVWDTITILPH